MGCSPWVLSELAKIMGNTFLYSMSGGHRNRKKLQKTAKNNFSLDFKIQLLQNKEQKMNIELKTLKYTWNTIGNQLKKVYAQFNFSNITPCFGTNCKYTKIGDFQEPGT